MVKQLVDLEGVHDARDRRQKLEDEVLCVSGNVSGPLYGERYQRSGRHLPGDATPDRSCGPVTAACGFPASTKNLLSAQHGR